MRFVRNPSIEAVFLWNTLIPPADLRIRLELDALEVKTDCTFGHDTMREEVSGSLSLSIRGAGIQVEGKMVRSDALKDFDQGICKSRIPTGVVLDDQSDAVLRGDGKAALNCLDRIVDGLLS